MKDLTKIDLSKVPIEPLGIPAPWLSNYYHCPKCKGQVNGIFGIKDKQNVSWALNECEECGYIYKVRTQ